MSENQPSPPPPAPWEQMFATALMIEALPTNGPNSLGRDYRIRVVEDLRYGANRLEKMAAAKAEAEALPLAEAAAKMLAAWRSLRELHGDLPGVKWDLLEVAVHTALEREKIA